MDSLQADHRDDDAIFSFKTKQQDERKKGIYAAAFCCQVTSSFSGNNSSSIRLSSPFYSLMEILNLVTAAETGVNWLLRETLIVNMLEEKKGESEE